MVRRRPETFDRNCLLDSIGIDPRVEERDDPAKRMTHQIDRGGVDYVCECGEIKHVLRDAVECARRPLAVAVTSQVDCVNVIMLTQGSRHPIPIASVIQSAVNQDQRRLVFIAPIPKVQLQPVRVVVVRDRFQVLLRGHLFV